ncbi:PIN domain-containing protein [Paraburkholderia sp.]|uniref:PIN domain-containing protein n=1 Tax=Paraburkholderia sp. TaxID=1926495 RepID=UPI002580CA16|nr:PIN domain-containing protein [Paraburkholderia sp.]
MIAARFFYPHAKMTNSPQKVFLDANVVIQEGKEGSPIIERMVDLVDAGLVSVLTTDLTMTEVAKKHAENDLDLVKDFARPHIRKVLSDVLGAQFPAVTKADMKAALRKKHHAVTEQMFKALKAKILSIDDVKPSDVFAAYANKEGFFSGEGKKDQFPDAFIFECLKKLASAESPIIIVSSDGDYAAPVAAMTNIKLVKTFAELFAELGLAIEPPDVQGFFEADHDELVSRFDDEVSSWGLQVSDVADAEIDESTVTEVTLDQFKAFRFVDEEQILVVGYAMVKADVAFTHPDWDTASWDSEDKIAIPHRDVSGETEVEFEVPFSMSLSVDESGKPVALDNLSFLDSSFVWVQIERYETYK